VSTDHAGLADLAATYRAVADGWTDAAIHGVDPGEAARWEPRWSALADLVESAAGLMELLAVTPTYRRAMFTDVAESARLLAAALAMPPGRSTP
jgi:hypothetical protein